MTLIENPIVSVLIPCYNVSNYVEKAVQSILLQTYTHLEIWIFDDGSTDDTLQKIKQFEDERIRIIVFNENTKKVGAVNDIFNRVTGDYITFQDADDWSEPTRIQEQLDEFKKNADLGICFTNFRYVGTRVFLPGRIALTNEELKKIFLNFYKIKDLPFEMPMCPTIMVSKAALKAAGIYPSYFAGRLGEDIYMAYRILKEYDGITIDKILYNYSKRDGSIMHNLYTGGNKKYAYSFELLSKIIHKHMYEGIDVFGDSNKEDMYHLELDACEEALVAKIKLLNETITLYKNSMSFKLGRLVLSPWRYLRKIKD